MLSLLSFDTNDPSLNHVVSGTAKVANKAGLFGAYAAGFLNDVLGVCALLCPLVFGALGAAYVSPSYGMHWVRWTGGFLLTVCLLVLSSATGASVGDLCGGGMVGNALYGNASKYLSPFGSSLLWLFVGLVGVQLVCNISWFALCGRGCRWLRAKFPGQNGGRGAADTPQDAAHGTAREAGGPSLLSRLSGRLRLPSPGLWRRGLEFFTKPRPAAEPLPPISAGDAFVDTVSPPVSPAEADADDPFAVARDAEGALISPPLSDDAGEDDTAAAAHEVPDRSDSTEAGASLNPADAGAAPVSAAVPPGKTEPARQARKARIPLPALDLLAVPEGRGSMSHADMELKGRELMACLQDFRIQGELVRFTPGPVVTVFEVRPAKGTRVSSIANLSGDIARSLKAVSVRIQAPIPGTDTVGIEIPNDVRELVNFRELASSEAFRKGCGPLTMILGKDIAGRPCMADLSRMPHLLMAGTTGAGKSVALNALLVSLLYRMQPADMQLLLVDPKRVELAVYADEPHLVHPVVTEMEDAKNALDWAVREMDKRYANMSRLRVRNITGFNQKLATYKNELPDDLADLEPMPYLIIVIDELAELMMTAGREAEQSIVRLAQLARAAGIHMIVATQRPSADVVTGLIKANFPCRISFFVNGPANSRIILDQIGAEKLLGNGDMLFKPSGGRLQRVQAPFISDDEVQAVVDHWKRQAKPCYTVDFTQGPQDAAATAGGGAGGGEIDQDALYPEVLSFVLEQGRASISLVQRRFKIGFNRAARLMENLERDGVIGQADGTSKPRPVVR